jgi:hypothetical protein
LQFLPKMKHVRNYPVSLYQIVEFRTIWKGHRIFHLGSFLFCRNVCYCKKMLWNKISFTSKKSFWNEWLHFKK